MICPKCHGLRRLWLGVDILIWECDYCYGEGSVHCCEGDCSQPEPKDNAEKSKA